MANHEIPRTAQRVERMHGIDADGNVITCSVYQHTRAGHSRPMFYVVQYRERNRRIDRSTRETRQFSGPAARAKLDDELTEARSLFAESRERAAPCPC
jgi:hypothetical protein